MASVQFPFGFSPQVPTDMNGQALNPAEETSFFRGIKRLTVVPFPKKERKELLQGISKI